MKNTFLKIATILILTISIFSCSPEDGKDGINGTNGIGSDLEYYATTWATRNFVGSGTTWYSTISIPVITQQVLDKGVILTFKKTATDEVVEVSNTTTPYFWIFHLLGNIDFESSSNQTGTYRHIILVPTVPTGVSRLRKTDYTKMSYQEICAKFNIPE